MPTSPALTLDYLNHRGERALRTVAPLEVWRGTSEFHSGEQWFLRANDLAKGAERDFALADILNWATEPAVPGAPQPGIYRHYKGHLYLLHGTGRHSETEEAHAVYRTLYGEFACWLRPLAMWSETVETPDGPQPRFAYVGPVSG